MVNHPKRQDNQRALSGHRRSRARTLRSKKLVSPTYPAQYGSTTLVDSDFNAHVGKQLAPYNTIGNQNFFWKSNADINPILQTAGADYSINVTPYLDIFPGSSDYKTVFDQYRLRAFTVMFTPQLITSPSALGSGFVFPRLWTVIDYDDTTGITRTQAEQYDTCFVTPPGCGVIRTVVPRIAIAAYSGAFTSYANMGDVWLDIASGGVLQYGIKLVVEGGAVGQTFLQQYSVSITGYWEFRSAR